LTLITIIIGCWNWTAGPLLLLRRSVVVPGMPPIALSP
jgi:hypothetical protein